MKKDTNLLDTQDVRAEAATALTPNATNGEKIKALRSAQGMSMAELSRRASMSDRAIRYIEAGEREPSVDAIQNNGEKIKALRSAQGMSMAELSRRASMSDRAIRYIEAGEREPSVDAIQNS